jgi:hypothetical protein
VVGFDITGAIILRKKHRWLMFRPA